jgi:predicted GNAT family acetyltransferase
MSEPQRMPTERSALHVRDVPEHARFEATVGADGELAGFLEYRLGTGWIALTHTEVLEGFEGQGIGSRLVRMVFDDLRRRGLPILVRCPFVTAWLRKHPEQHDLLYRPLEPPDPDGPAPA